MAMRSHLGKKWGNQLDIYQIVKPADKAFGQGQVGPDLLDVIRLPRIHV